MCVCGQLFLTLCDNRDSSQSDSSVHGVVHTGILEWVAFTSSGQSSQLRGQTWVSCVSCIGRHILYHWTTWKPNIVIGMLNQWRGWQNHEQMKVLLTLPGADSVIGYMTDKTQDSGGSNSTAFQNLHHCKKWLHGEQSLELPFYRPRFICYFVKFRAKNIP